MELFDRNGKKALSAHASKQSKIDFKIFTAHSSAMVPFGMILIYPSWLTFKIAVTSTLVLVLLERRGWTLGLAVKRIRSKLAGKSRHAMTRQRFNRRMRLK
ncbi:IcmT/TraK family protein [Pseudomonas aeruginosa]|uniref:IcmT/TraK family protein n=1 Tax=Pseudomonas aeruginosa group TaxID=136841 RepID=UPI0003BB24C2|nr:IcmT/TraK family protein [Pseudomonas aeruginosa]EIU2716866.1 IcmT/TraK family protein [Pseudomonas aeruginosa]EIU2862431.1 IcmT/TraK family protein [Pseudomonas aeruginosa]EKX0638578.1 IcmT/TraK family protein [Pseudomonas aeruginosa]EKY4114565.1 IcmT/TraK family protein [Pseudomonas aeruginosa]ELD5772881.1 IcmT/TraK family protein [Pseudomonas aeruginosa]